MAEHKLKIWPGFFEELVAGRKTCEIRKDDRGFKVGDTLALHEYRPVANEFTGRKYKAIVTHITRAEQDGLVTGLSPGYVVMSLSVRL